MRVIAILFVLFLIVGCVSPQKRISVFSDDWVGRPFDDFVRANGPPADEYSLADGGTVYTFRFRSRAASPRPEPECSMWSKQGPFPVACDLRVEADPGGVITSIAIDRDMIGRGFPSRCWEILPETQRAKASFSSQGQ